MPEKPRVVVQPPAALTGIFAFVRSYSDWRLGYATTLVDLGHHATAIGAHRMAAVRSPVRAPKTSGGFTGTGKYRITTPPIPMLEANTEP